MQLRQLWAVIARRWLILVLVVGLATVGGAAALAFGPRQYSAEVRLLLNRVPSQTPAATPDFRYDDYYRFLATEYVLDDLVEEVHGNRFALAVLERLNNRGILGMSDEAVMRGLKAERMHRILTVEVTAPTRDAALGMARAVEELLTSSADQFRPPDGSRVNVKVIHSDPVAHSNLPRALLIFILQVALAVLLGLGLVLLLDYLDDRVRGVEDAAALGLPLLGRLPASAARGR
jgi:capsular polysaccharide biosynthesis protein